MGFVNGLPLLVIVFKKPGVSARVAFDDNLSQYKAAILKLFWSNAFVIASKNTASRIGLLSADWERFFEWERIKREDEPRGVSLEVLLRGTCRYVFTLIQKFRIPALLSDRIDVVITDEAHLSQYETLAVYMRTAMPKTRI